MLEGGGAGATGGGSAVAAPAALATVAAPIRRLNYIGSKYQLLTWLTDTICAQTGWTSLAGHKVADLFAGTGVVSHWFRQHGATVATNDAEAYSAIIAHAFTRSVATERVLALLATLQTEMDTAAAHTSTTGFVSTHYAPNPVTGSTRMFFTLDNARRIDYLRERIEAERSHLTDDEHKFVLASLLLAADAVSNVPAVYGCFLKNFKQKALQPLRLQPVHQTTIAPSADSCAYHSDVLALASTIDGVEAVYLDPPYNTRHYSKNYFPLNTIALPPTEAGPALHGKTGIPDDCFLSPFSSSLAAATAAFDRLFTELKPPWLFLSYSNEGTVSREKMEELLAKHGTVVVVEREYQRFKSFEYNATGTTKEYLFCLRRRL
jgi:adenine-specific DNA-methyltransferase